MADTLFTIGLWLTIGVTAVMVSMGGYTLAWDLSDNNKVITAALGTPLALFMFVISAEFLRIL